MAKSRRAFAGPKKASKPKPKSMVSLIYCLGGSMSNFRSIGHRLTTGQNSAFSLRAKPRRAFARPQKGSKLKPKPMVGLVYCSGGSLSNFRSIGHRLTKSQSSAFSPTAKPRRAFARPQKGSKPKPKPMVGLIYCSGGSMSNFRSFRHRLTISQSSAFSSQ